MNPSDTNSANITVPVTINKNRLLFIFTANYRSDSPGDEVEKHCHSFYEIHYFMQGAGVMTAADNSVRFAPGSLLLIAPETYHLQQRDFQSEILKYIFKFSVQAAPNRHDTILTPLLRAADASRILLFPEVGDAKALLDSIQTELQNTQKGFLVQIANDLSSLLVLLARRFRPEDASADESDASEKEVPTETEIIIDQFFDQNYNRNAKCSDLCELVHLSQSQLSRILKEMYSMTFKEKHAQTRILYIQHLLSKPDLSVTEIAYKSGFDCVSSLSNYFRHYAKISPLEYRKQRHS